MRYSHKIRDVRISSMHESLLCISDVLYTVMVCIRCAESWPSQGYILQYPLSVIEIHFVWETYMWLKIEFGLRVSLFLH